MFDLSLHDSFPIPETSPLFHTLWYHLNPNWNNTDIEELMSAAFTIRDKMNEVLVSEPPGNYDAIVIAKPQLYSELKVHCTCFCVKDDQMLILVAFNFGIL